MGGTSPSPKPTMSPIASPAVLITGCSSGIGLATALELARSGRTVVAGVKSLDEQGSLREDARTAGVAVDMVPLDITDEASVRGVLDYVAHKYGGLSALVNNAGIGGAGFFEDLDETEVRELFETNFFGTARLTRLAIPLLRKAAPSHLVTLSSMAGRLGVPAMSVYHATKFALEGLCECLYYELRPHGVRVVLVEPGLIRTPIMGSAFRLAKRFADPASVNHARAQKIWAEFQTRFQRTAQPPAIVATAIARILADPDPPLRRPVGADARIILAIRGLLPEGVWHALWRRVAG